MLSNTSDRIRAAVGGFGLLSIAIGIFYRMDMESLGAKDALVWPLCLLPGWVVYIFADTAGIRSHGPSVGVALWLFVLVLSYFWYFAVSYVAIRIYRGALRLFEA